MTFLSERKAPRAGARRTARCVSAAIGFMLATSAASAQGKRTGAPGDSAQFAAVVAAILESHAAPIKVDPRPLIADPIVTEALTQWHANVEPHVITARQRILQSASIDTISDVSARGCPGRLLPPGILSKASCPASRFTLIAVGLARAGGAYLPDGIDEREAGARLGEHAVRVIATELVSSGAVVTVADYVIKSAGGSWVFVKRVVLLYLH